LSCAHPANIDTNTSFSSTFASSQPNFCTSPPPPPYSVKAAGAVHKAQVTLVAPTKQALFTGFNVGSRTRRVCVGAGRGRYGCSWRGRRLDRHKTPCVARATTAGMSLAHVMLGECRWAWRTEVLSQVLSCSRYKYVCSWHLPPPSCRFPTVASLPEAFSHPAFPPNRPS